MLALTLHFSFDPPVGELSFDAREAAVERIETQGPGPIAAARVAVTMSDARQGARKALLTLRADRCAFTFAPIDLRATGRIRVAAYGVTICLDPASPAPGAGLTKLQAVEQAPEESFEIAAGMAQDFPSPTVLGLGRDNRVFLVDPRLETITIANSMRPPLATLHLPIGRGRGARTDLRRRLDQGALPILRAEKVDGDIAYEAVLFATLADRELREENVDGVNFLVAEEGLGMPHTPEQAARREAARAAHAPPPLMLCCRLQAVNRSPAPAYAFFYRPWLHGKDVVLRDGRVCWEDEMWGSLRFEGQPWPQDQICALLAPGEAVTAEYRLLHAPAPVLSSAAGADLWQRAFDELLAQARAFWQGKLDRAARLQLPEPRIDEMARAGLLHLDLITYGRRQGALAATIGWYSPIGTESSPIIQFYDSMGWHDAARRSLQYFAEKQHADGRFQNFGGYMLETGAALWSMGEHHRYTRDDAWAAAMRGAVEAACGWITRHRAGDTPPGQPGAGLIKGKVADPEDPYHQFMLNAYQCLGLARAGEMMRGVDPALADRATREAAAYRDDIRRELRRSLVESPVVPLGDGRWVPPGAPWVEAAGPGAFSLDGQPSYTHESVYARDSMLGPIYAVFAELFDPRELEADFLVESHYEHMLQDGVAFSQPYYARHPWIHLKRGETRAFLRSYYRAMAGLADRQTHSFWEHYFGASPHKTHEEAWFLMETRWMLYLEEGAALRLLAGVPRAWLQDGRSIGATGVKSYFGALDFQAVSGADDGWIEARIRCPQGASRGLRTLVARLPHPQGRRARAVDGPGDYDPASETVRLPWPAGGEASVRLLY